MSTPDYLDPSLTPAQRVADLLPRMTIEEKAGLFFHPATSLPEPGLSEADALAAAHADAGDRLISHFNVFNGADAAEIAAWNNTMQEIAADTRLGIPITLSSDPRSGFHSTPFTGQTLDSLSRWPEHTGLGAIDDPEVVRAYGDTIRREFLAMGIRVYLGPMADVFSEPRWSRGYGTFGEDVETVSRLTVAFIEGLRGGTRELSAESVAAVVKHFPGGGPQLRGEDAHDARHPEQVYPGGQQELHLRPFEAAFTAGVTQLMTYYGMPVGTDWEERGFAFNRPVVKDLLREHYGFTGIVLSDWNVIDATEITGLPFGPNGYGLLDVSPTDRLQVALEVGVDQFGGDRCVERIVDLVRSGRVSEERIDESVARILHEKFALRLFENRFVDVDAARAIGSDAGLRARGESAQAASLVLLAEDGERLPVVAGSRVYGEGIDWMEVQHNLIVVPNPADAEVAVLRLDAPWQSDPDNVLGDYFHGGGLEFSGETIAHVAEVAAAVPTVVVVYLERPAVVTPLLSHATTLIADFGASDQVVLDALLGRRGISGRLPFDLPRSGAAVEASREDVPFDTAEPVFRHGDGITRAPQVARYVA